jgi:hypothetical protein
MLKTNKAVTAIELLLAVTIIAIIMTAIASATVIGIKIYKNLQEEAIKKQNMIVVSEHLNRHVKDSAYIIVSDANNITLYDEKDFPLGSYVYDLTNKTLSFEGAEVAGDLTLSFSGRAVSDGKARGLDITITEPFLNTLYFTCRHSYSSGLYVKNETKNKFYNTIQNALNGASNNDEIRCMGAVDGIFDGIFNENVVVWNYTVSAYTLKGGYDESFSDANRDAAAYPTIIEGDLIFEQEEFSTRPTMSFKFDGLKFQCLRGNVFSVLNLDILNSISENEIQIEASVMNSRLFISDSSVGSLHGNGLSTLIKNSTFDGVISLMNVHSDLKIYNNEMKYITVSRSGSAGGVSMDIANNIADGMMVYASDGDSITIKNHKLDAGGGISGSGSDTVRIVNNEISGCLGIAAISWNEGKRIILENNTITGNSRDFSVTPSTGQDTIDIRSAETVTINKNIITDNFKQCGLYVVGTGTSNITITNSLFANKTDGWGGMRLYASGDTAINHVTVAGNTVLYGVGSKSDVDVKNSILWNESIPELKVIYGSPVFQVNNTDIKGGWSGTGSDNIGDDLIAHNPDFADAANGDYTLSSSSPCLTISDTGGDVGAYGNLSSGETIGSHFPVSDDPSTEDIREDVIGTY